jgi:hypothetical protein
LDKKKKKYFSVTKGHPGGRESGQGRMYRNYQCQE